jgi:cytoskeletal protein RodZ
MEERRTLGERIEAGRRRKRLSVMDVALATKINPYYLRAMERGDLHLLPAMVYVKGYVRSVGRLLGLDCADLYSMLPASEGGAASA